MQGCRAGYEHPTDTEGYIVNEFGMEMREGPVYMDVIVHPLANVQTAEDIAAFPFPDPLAEGRYDDAAHDIAKYKDDYFIVGDMELTMFDMMQQLVGLEKLLVDMAQGADYLEPLMDKCKDFAVAAGKKLVAMGVDGIWAGDDFGAQNGMLISPRMWRRYLQGTLSPDLRRAEGGQPGCHHLPALRRRGGSDPGRLDRSWAGGVQPGAAERSRPRARGLEDQVRRPAWRSGVRSISRSCCRSARPAEIEADVKAKIAVLGRGGGYMCSPAHIIQADTSMANVEAFIAAVKKHGVYV